MLNYIWDYSCDYANDEGINFAIEAMIPLISSYYVFHLIFLFIFEASHFIFAVLITPLPSILPTKTGDIYLKSPLNLISALLL